MDPSSSSMSTGTSIVEIYLVAGESPTSFLCIPIQDVKRLSVRPFKWLRFMMYSICGAPGEISATPRGDPVEYDSTELAEVRYYYEPQGKLCFCM
jgi:hypothetical protein